MIYSTIRKIQRSNNIDSPKGVKTIDVIDCSFIFFKNYLESKFESWMNWDNYGKYNGDVNYGWDIDHIIPIVTAKTVEDLYND